MSRHRCQSEMRRCIGCLAYSILGGLLLASQLVLPSTTFAIATRTASSANPPTSQSFALSAVSVVRLVYSYSASPASTGNPVLCTSVGVLVKSIAAGTSSTPNTWVLTDGSLLKTAPAPCSPSGSSSRSNTSTVYALSSINVYANDAYTGNASAHALLGTYTVAATNAPLCFATPCTNGAFFFSFHTDQLQPILNVASTNTLQQFGIALTSQASATARPPTPLTNVAAAMAFLNPTQVMLDVTSSQNEAGMPFINNAGQMIAMHLQNSITLTSADYNAFVAQQPTLSSAVPNPLQVAWENGIAAYYSHNYHDAIKNFQIVEGLNPNLVAAKTFAQSAATLSTTQSNPVNGTSTPSTETTTYFGIPMSTLLIVGFAAGAVLLILFLLFVILWTRRRRELTRFKAEQAEAQQNAEREVLQQQKAQQQNSPIEITNNESWFQDKATRNQSISIINPSLSSDQLCPRCGHAVTSGAIFCANCRFQLGTIEGNATPTLEFPDIGKASSPSVTTSQPLLVPNKEIVLDDLTIQKTLKRLWNSVER